MSLNKETNTGDSLKSKVQKLVDCFGTLDIVERNCFLHCIIPLLNPTELKSLQQSIQLHSLKEDSNTFSNKKTTEFYDQKSYSDGQSDMDSSSDSTSDDEIHYISKADNNSKSCNNTEEKIKVDAKGGSKPQSGQECSMNDKSKYWECKECNLFYHSQEELTKHNIRHVERPYKCEECSRSFLLPETFKKHKKLHENAKKFNCNDSNEEYDTMADLSWHLQVEQFEKKKFECPVCSREYKYARLLQKHMAEHPGYMKTQDDNSEDQIFDSYRCDLCHESFSNRGALWRHQKKHKGERPHKCEICAKAFLDKSTLITHKRTHTGEKPYICDTCGLTFAQNCNLKSHIANMHQGKRRVKNVMCDRCPKTFKDKCSLMRHYVIHTGEKQFMCSHCSRCFARASDLQVHERTHTGERPFVCSYCNKAFSDSSNLKVHEKIHTGGDVCPICKKNFRNVREFRKHKKICKESTQQSEFYVLQSVCDDTARVEPCSFKITSSTDNILTPVPNNDSIMNSVSNIPVEVAQQISNYDPQLEGYYSFVGEKTA